MQARDPPAPQLLPRDPLVSASLRGLGWRRPTRSRLPHGAPCACERCRSLGVPGHPHSPLRPSGPWRERTSHVAANRWLSHTLPVEPSVSRAGSRLASRTSSGDDGQGAAGGQEQLLENESRSAASPLFIQACKAAPGLGGSGKFISVARRRAPKARGCPCSPAPPPTAPASAKEPSRSAGAAAASRPKPASSTRPHAAT